MKEKFRELKLNKNNIKKLDVVNSIIDEYAADWYRMTLRQLYYQLVSRDIIPNKQAEYAKISKLLTEWRMGWVVDWNAIEDRLRIPDIPYCNDSPEEAVADAIHQYRLNRQEWQSNYIEVWVEKDALSWVLKRVTGKYHINLLVNRWYASVTAIHDAYKRFKKHIDSGRNCIVLYLWDHDPSWMDMIRDLDKRVSEMLKVDDISQFFGIKPIALTMEQIEFYNPPKNPAKLTDPRAKWYIKEYGESSWEVDALEPKILNKLLTNNINESIDIDLYNSVLEKEEEDKKILEKLSKNI